MLQYKIDVFSELKNAGYTSYRIQKENILSNSTTTKIRSGEIVSAKNLDTLCRLLHCQLSDIVEYVPDAVTDEKTSC